MKLLQLLLGSLVSYTFASSSCENGIECKELPLQQNGLTFQCRFAGPLDGIPVILLHGYPEWSSIYADLMRVLADKGFRSVACNQRGYSEGARPDGIENYHYSILSDDVFAVAEEVGFTERFHLIGK